MFYDHYDFGVSLSDIDDMNDFSPVPPGDYVIQANHTAIKNTKVGDGMYLQFEFEITTGAYANRKIFQNVIVSHPNEDAKRIGLQWLKSWIMSCDGIGNERLTLPLVTRFLGKPCAATIIIEEGKAGYGPKNKIQRFKKVEHTSLEDVAF